jgi:hypothetical protein
MNGITQPRNIAVSFKFYPPNAYGPGGDARVMNRVLEDVKKKLSGRKYEEVTRVEIR